MNNYILFMHDDAANRAIADDPARWESYISALRASGQFDGGSSIGDGKVCRKNSAGAENAALANVTGYIRVRAESMQAAQRFLKGNPVYEAGGTVEVRELRPD